jgi:predicted dehydrogenase
MMEAQKESTAFAAIGFQWSFSHAIQSLKRDIMEGVLGRPVRLSTLVLWPRPMQYFQRNDWAGKIRMPDGAGVFDSPVNNATAHFLHNMLYILGRTRETSATPLTLQSELYRANEIENYDTAALRCVMDEGVELLFYTTHAVPDRRGPRCRYEFEKAVVEFDGAASGQFVAHFKDGRTKYYGRPNADRHEKIWQAITAVRGGQSVACGVDAALPHVMCVHAAQQSGEIVGFPSRLRRMMDLDGEAMCAIDGLDAQFTECYERGILPSEHAASTWARAGKVVDVRHPQATGEKVDGQADGQLRRPQVSVTIPAAAATVRT